jgi:hypothetical protein
VRIALDPVPANVRLVAGQTATVKVLPTHAAAGAPAAPARAATASDIRPHASTQRS